MLMANAVSQLAAKTAGKEALAIESFATALRQVIITIQWNMYLRKPMLIYQDLLRNTDWWSH